MLFLLAPQLLEYSYAQSYDGCCAKQLELIDYGFSSTNSYVNVTVSEAKQMIESNPSLVILDVRAREEYESGHIENAVLIPVGELQNRIAELDKEKETLVYCKLGGRSATASGILVANGFKAVYNMLGGITAWRNAGYWIEIVHKGDLIIDGTQTFVIENCTYIQVGNMSVGSSATLVIRNAKLFMNMTQEWEYYVRIQNNASLIVERSEIVGSQYFSLHASETATVNVSKSSISLCSMPCEGESKVYMVNSSIYYIPCYDHSKISITNSTLKDVLVCDTSEVYIKSSDVGQIATEWSNTKMSVTSLNEGYIEYWNNHINITIFDNQDFNLTFRDSTIHKWSLRFAEGSQVSITNSKIASLRLYAFQGTLSLEKVTVVEAIEIDRSKFFMCGNLSFSEETQIATWTNSNVTRKYEIITRDMSDVPVTNVKLTLFDKNYAVIWNGTADSLRQADFNLTFTDANYTDALCLKARSPGRYSATRVSFLSSTPINMSLTVLGDLNNDGGVYIVDLYMVAKAYFSNPYDPTWNPIVDLNDDGRINIEDIFVVAKQYGKTV